MAPQSCDAVAKIVVEMLEREMDRPRVEEEAAKAKEFERYYEKNQHMHPDNWVGAIWPDGRALYYRKDLGPPSDVVEGLASGVARLLGGKRTTPTSPSAPGSPADPSPLPRRSRRRRPPH